MTERKTVTQESEPLYVYFLPDYHGPVITTEVRPGLLFDTTPDNQLIGIEVLEYERFTVAASALPESADEELREALNEAADYIADVATDSDGMEVDGFFLVEKLRALAATLPEPGEGS